MATASDILVETLQAWGVEVIFGIPGDGINGVMEALRQRQDKIRFIQARHEESAAFMACGYAKYTGKLGVCLATSGPGAIHLLNGLYDAKADGQPVLAITGNTFHDIMNTAGQQDVSLDRLFDDVALYNVRVMGPNHVNTATNLACRTAITQRGVTHITFPVDLQTWTASDDQLSMHNPDMYHTSSVYTHQHMVPGNEDLRRAADILNQGEKIAILVGQGALRATDEVEMLAEKLGAPVIKALLGKAVLPDDNPYTTGGLGLLGTKPSEEVMDDCDTLLMIGTSFPYMEYLPKPGKARGVQIDIDPTRIGLRFPVEVGLVGDSKSIIQVLLPLLKPNENRQFLETAQKSTREWWDLMEYRGTRKDKPMKPQVVAWELGKRLNDTAIISCDSGTNTTWWARQIPAKRGQIHSVSGTLASMACALPYAIAAQIAYPERQCIAFAGDGGFSMLMADFVTCVKYNLPIKVIVINNRSLGQIKWEQMVFLGNPEYGCDLQPIDFAAFARACGGAGFTIEDPAHCGAILDQALATPGPVVIDAIVDPLEPPMPARIKPEEALKLAQSLAKGQPDREKIFINALSNKVRELINM